MEELKECSHPSTRTWDKVWTLNNRAIEEYFPWPIISNQKSEDMQHIFDISIQVGTEKEIFQHQMIRNQVLNNGNCNHIHTYAKKAKVRGSETCRNAIVEWLLFFWKIRVRISLRASLIDQFLRPSREPWFQLPNDDNRQQWLG